MARADESVGVGGTGASEWSEPTKGSGMDLRDFIPEADRRFQRDISDIEVTRGEEEASEPELTPAGEVPVPDVLLDDPSLYDIGFTGERPRGRRPGQRTNRRAQAARRVAFSGDVDPEEILRLAAKYEEVPDEETPIEGPTPAELADIAREEGAPAAFPTRGSPGAASDVERVLAKLGLAPKYGPPGQPGSLSPSEWNLLTRHWELERPPPLRGMVPDVPEGPADIDWDEMEAFPRGEDEGIHPGNVYVYDNPEQFSEMQPDIFDRLPDEAVVPGTFMRVSRDFPHPGSAPSMDPDDPSFDEDAYFGYLYKKMTNEAAQLVIPVEDGREWIFFFPENERTERGDIDGSWYFNPDEYEWKRIDKWWERGELTDKGEWGEVGSLDPTQAEEFGLSAPVGGIRDVPESERFIPPEEEERWQPHPEHPGRFWDPGTGELYGYRTGVTPHERRLMARGVKVSEMPDVAPFDVEPESTADLEASFRRTYGESTMRVRDFFTIDERKLSSYEHPRTHLAKKFEDDPDIENPWALAQHIAQREGVTEAHGERAERLGHYHAGPAARTRYDKFRASTDPTAAEFEDLTSSWAEEPDFGTVSSDDWGEELPGTEGGEIEVPPGVFQGEEGGFGRIEQPFEDEMETMMGNEEPLPLSGGPDDPEIAGPIADPGFGQEEDDWARPEQTGEGGPRHRTRVRLSGDEPRSSGRGGRRI